LVYYWGCQDTRPLTPDDCRRTCQHYWAFCTHLDDELGRLLRRLDDMGLWDDTVVAFCADHGEMLGAHGNFDKGPYLCDEVLRIPLIVHDPKGRTPPDPDGFVGLRDLFPTLIGLAGTDGILPAAAPTSSTATRSRRPNAAGTDPAPKRR
jgi:arylsulfatase A-like enzyme